MPHVVLPIGRGVKNLAIVEVESACTGKKSLYKQLTLVGICPDMGFFSSMEIIGLATTLANKLRARQLHELFHPA